MRKLTDHKTKKRRVKIMGKCERSNCLLYSEKRDNNCKGLRSTYDDDYTCRFFKEKETVENEKKEVEEE